MSDQELNKCSNCNSLHGGNGDCCGICQDTVILTYQKTVQDQEIELVNLQVEACLRASEFRELAIQLEHANARLDDRSQVITALRTEITKLYDELSTWRDPAAY